MTTQVRWIGLWIVMGFASYAWAVGDPPIKELRGYCSTGEEIAGPVVKADARSVTLRLGRRTRKIYTVNLLEWSMELSKDQEAALENLSPRDRAISIGKSLLQKRWTSLAELQFRKAFSLDPDSKEAILTAYKDAQAKPPSEALFVPVPYRYTRQRIDHVKANTKAHRDLAVKMKAIAPKTHIIETEHFVIYSAWPKSDDRRLSTIYKKLYRALCKQFVIPPEENIWIGKLPVFAFWEAGNYIAFSSTGLNASIGVGAAGFAGRRGPFSYVCLGPVRAKKGGSKAAAINWFYELLCHETTHAFLGRYISDRHLINWLNEGIAETMVAHLVPRGAQTKIKLAMAHKQVKGGWLPAEGLMFRGTNIPLDGVYYGCAQSMARYLIARDRKKFIQLVTLIKKGTAPEEALRESYGFKSYTNFLNTWKKKIR